MRKEKFFVQTCVSLALFGILTFLSFVFGSQARGDTLCYKDCPPITGSFKPLEAIDLWSPEDTFLPETKNLNTSDSPEAARDRLIPLFGSGLALENPYESIPGADAPKKPKMKLRLYSEKWPGEVSGRGFSISISPKCCSAPFMIDGAVLEFKWSW